MGRLAAAAEQILADQVVAVPLLRRPVVSVVRPGVAGYVSHPSRAAALWSIEQWHLATGATTGG
jgi:ABC-type transport system substrate-binding protein